jgi:hypothetical protein
MSDSGEYHPAMHRRVCRLLGLLGFGWVLWLFFSSPELTMWPPGSGEASVTVSCRPLGSLSREPLDPDDPLTSEQSSIVDDYVKKASQDDAGQQRLNDLQDEVETAIITHCEAVRLDRVALLGVTALPTGLLLLVAVVGARPWRNPDPDSAPTPDSDSAPTPDPDSAPTPDSDSAPTPDRAQQAANP